MARCCQSSEPQWRKRFFNGFKSPAMSCSATLSQRLKWRLSPMTAATKWQKRLPQWWVTSKPVENTTLNNEGKKLVVSFKHWHMTTLFFSMTNLEPSQNCLWNLPTWSLPSATSRTFAGILPGSWSGTFSGIFPKSYCSSPKGVVVTYFSSERA